VLNVLEAFFRRPWLHLLPLILLVALGGATAFSKEEAYRTTGTITAEASTVIGDLTQPNNNGFTFQSPATIVATNINEMLRTTQFLNNVALALNADAPEGQQATVRRTIATSVRAFDDGEQLVRVAATTERPDLSLSLAQATIDTYIATVTANNAQEYDEAITFFEGQVQTALEDYEAAQARLNDFVIANNITDDAEVPAADRITLESLRSEVDRKVAQYDAQLASLAQAQQQRAATITEVEQRIRVTDPPELPLAPEPRLKAALMTLIIFGVLGALLSLASVIVDATLDRTIRVPGDITGKFGLDVLAVVPDARAR
jgi:uncharacterized protein involved in exopolysaccharide biosynthesis